VLRERVSDNVYVFTSEIYAQVNAGAVVGPDWVVLIDTLAHPEEILELKSFLEDRIGRPVRYIINTHHHTDHTLGNSLFPRATILAHALCRESLEAKGRQALELARANNPELHDVRLRLPDVTFRDGRATIRLGRRVLQVLPLPGHSADGVGVLVVEDRVLFAGDVMMPLPTLTDGNYDQMLASLKSIPRLKLENLVLGHGESVMRGEINAAIRSNLSYLAAIRKHVRKAIRLRDPEGYLREIDVEQCGKRRILLNGLAPELHARNLQSLLRKWYRRAG
jgi:glyoxylase-like metal-dependent hydrolase (beta-lactamase superfamily II)